MVNLKAPIEGRPFLSYFRLGGTDGSRPYAPFVQFNACELCAGPTIGGLEAERCKGTIIKGLLESEDAPYLNGKYGLLDTCASSYTFGWTGGKQGMSLYHRPPCERAC